MAIETISHELKVENLLADLDAQYAEKYQFCLLDAWQYRETVRQKYKLPENTYLFDDPVRYINEIGVFCQRNEIDLRHKDEFDGFFETNPTAGAVSLGKSVFRDTTLVVQRSSDDDWYGLRMKAKQLSHEVVHAMQEKMSPRMPDDVAEREAYYYQMFTPRIIDEYSDNPEILYHWVGTVIEGYVRDSVSINKEINGRNESVNSIL